MKQSYLIQRLEKPFQYKIAGKEIDNPFSFGGGLRNGGLSEDAMKLLRPIFSFDYMGSAEFEFGEVPKAISKIAENINNYIAFEVPVKFSYKSWADGKTKTGTRPVYVICPSDYRAEVVSRIRVKALGEHSTSKNNFRTKESVGLDRSLAEEKYSEKLIGWLELDNGYFFFKDKEAFDKTRELFGLQVTA